MVGVTSTRVALPLECTESLPIYVNAKQYSAILKRRQVRAKLEVQNKLVKDRKVRPSNITFSPANNLPTTKLWSYLICCMGHSHIFTSLDIVTQ